MSQAAALAQRLQEVILDGMWIANTNFKKELDNTSLDEVSIQIKTYVLFFLFCFTNISTMCSILYIFSIILHINIYTNEYHFQPFVW